jgi:YgiT-type zinc finger domain-containing protein
MSSTICPTCGSDRIQHVVRNITRKYKGQEYIVPDVAFFDCPNCGEKLYDHAAMQKIETYSPAYHKVSVVAEP